MGNIRFLAGLLCLLVAAYVAAQDKYTTRYDHLDVNTILKNDRLLNSFINCILDKGPCTPEGKELKARLPDGLRTSCVKCSDRQKTFIKTASKYLIEHRPDDWKEITAKFDPQTQYRESFSRFLNEK